MTRFQSQFGSQTNHGRPWHVSTHVVTHNGCIVGIELSGDNGHSPISKGLEFPDPASSKDLNGPIVDSTASRAATGS